MERQHTPRDLKLEADRILADAGFSKSGTQLIGGASSQRHYLQQRFEYRMQTGAYCSSKARRKR